MNAVNTMTKPASGNYKILARITAVVLALITVTLAGLYLYYAWNRYQQSAEAEALQLAQSAADLLPASRIATLLQNPDQKTSEYKLIKESLVKLVEKSKSVYYAYIVFEKDGGFFSLADSNPNLSAVYPLPDQVGNGKNFNYAPIFQDDSPVLTQPFENQWGAWIRAMAHIKDPVTDKTIAVLVLNYPSAEWQAKLWAKMMPDIIVTMVLIIFVLALFSLWKRYTRLKKDKESLAFQEALYRNIFEQVPVGIILREGKEIETYARSLSINPMAKAILGRSEEELMNLTWPELTHQEDLEKEKSLYERFAKGEIHSYSIEKRLIKPDGSTIWTHVRIADFSESAPYNSSMYLCLLEDISARKKSEEALRESERSKSVFLSHFPGMAYRCKYDRDWTMEFVSDGCYALTGYKPESLIDNRGISFNNIIAPEYRQFLWEEWGRVLPQRRRFQAEYKIITRSGEYKWVLELGQGVYDANGNVEALEGIVLDITEQKEREYEITYLREHDFLTGLYNRNYMEREKHRLDKPEYWPLSVFICDIVGLRMINDAYSHAEGDRLILRTAKLIQSCLRKGDVMGRLTGGEFMLLLPNTNNQAAHQIKTSIKEVITKYNNSRKNKLYAVNLTIGYSTKGTKDQDIEEVIKEAEEYLKHQKLLNQNSSHSVIVSAIMATLYAKSQETEDHGQRLGRYCQMIGKQLGLEQKCLSELYLVSKLHDIGKIGIDDRILNKPDKLTAEEWEIMKKHPEIGHRIAMATPQLQHIAEYILYHHERWDGKGYPRGLKGEDIPLVSRILAVADAFDAMTEDRVYRKGLSKEVALAEIKRNAGTQFDPEIVKIFIDLMKNEILMAAAR